MTKIEDEINSDLDNMIKRYRPITLFGTFLNSDEIVEKCKDLLCSELPELLQLDLTKKKFDGEYDALAYTCIELLIKKNNLQDTLTQYLGSDLDHHNMMDMILVGCPVFKMQENETKSSFIQRIGASIAMLRLNFVNNVEMNNIHDHDQPDEFEIPEEGMQTVKILLGLITDNVVIFDEKLHPDEVDDFDAGYQNGFKNGVGYQAEITQIALYKMFKKKMLVVDDCYEFLDDLNSIIEGFSEIDLEKWRERYGEYYNNSQNKIKDEIKQIQTKTKGKTKNVKKK